MGIPVGQIVNRIVEEEASVELIYGFIEEFIESVERLNGMMPAAENNA